MQRTEQRTDHRRLSRPIHRILDWPRAKSFLRRFVDLQKGFECGHELEADTIPLNQQPAEY
jgi:hypothetical protein